jgi:hypothetical protein
MGQSRYERLPKTQNWQDVVALLTSPEASAATVASATVKSCRVALKQHSDDPVLVSAVYLLAHLPVAARQGKAAEFLRQVGLDARALSSPMALVEETCSFLNKQSFQNAHPSFVTEISLRAFQETAQKLIAESNLDLFADAREQTEQVLANYGTARGFARASRYFFTSFMNRVLSYFLSKENVNAVGPSERFESVDSLQRFMGDLRRYCWESSKIIDSFAEEWYSKYKWQQKLDVPHFATFVWASLRKFATEMGREHGDA